MTLILVAFFGIVIAVNVTMARFAVSTFGGTVVDNSYVASQHFNGWLAQARAERALGWQVAITRAADGRLIVDARDAGGRMLDDAVVTAIAHHPLGRVPEQRLQFTRGADGRYESNTALVAGRWQITATVRSGTHLVRAAQAIQL
jgi:nitrogen fixation protein FixH